MSKPYRVNVKNVCKDYIVCVQLNEGAEKDISNGQSCTNDLDLAVDKLTIRKKDNNSYPYRLRLPSDPANGYKMTVEWNENKWVLRMKGKSSSDTGPEDPTDVNVTVGEDEPTVEG